MFHFAGLEKAFFIDYCKNFQDGLTCIFFGESERSCQFYDNCLVYWKVAQVGFREKEYCTVLALANNHYIKSFWKVLASVHFPKSDPNDQISIFF